jgi:hypothetical protein
VAEAAQSVRASVGAGADDALNELEASLSLPVEAGLASESPLLQALAVLDARVGKRRLSALLQSPPEHPLVQAVLHLRCEAEAVRPRPPVV